MINVENKTNNTKGLKIILCMSENLQNFINHNLILISKLSLLKKLVHLKVSIKKYEYNNYTQLQTYNNI